MTTTRAVPCPPEYTNPVQPTPPGTVPEITIGEWSPNFACVVAVATRSGDVLGTLPMPGRPTALSADGTIAYIVRDDPECNSLMVGAYDLRSHRVDWIGPGSRAAVSRDGKWLAFASSGAVRAGQRVERGANSSCSQHDIVIRDLISGQERLIQSPLIGDVSRIAWSPDGRYLALSALGGDVNHACVLDLVDGTVGGVAVDESIDVGAMYNDRVVRGWTADGQMVLDVYPYPSDASVMDRAVTLTGTRVSGADGHWWYEMRDPIGPARGRFVIASAAGGRLLDGFRDDSLSEIAGQQIALHLWFPLWPASAIAIAQA